MRPAAIIERLDLRRPIYQRTAAYGHFGRTDRDFTWERTDHADELQARPPKRSPRRACPGLPGPARRPGGRPRVRLPRPRRARRAPCAVGHDRARAAARPAGARLGRRRRRRAARGRPTLPRGARGRRRPARRPTWSTSADWAAWRWAGPARQRSSAPRRRPTSSTADDPRPSVETAVYPGARRSRGARARRWSTAARRWSTCRCAPPRGRRSCRSRRRARARARSRVRCERRRVARCVTLAFRALRRRCAARHWRAGRAPGACVVVGGRTAVWRRCPTSRAVVVLDEADEALEEERAPTWNARDVAARTRRRARAPRFVCSRRRRPSTRVAAIGRAERRRRRRARRGRASRWSTSATSSPGTGCSSAALADALRHTVDRGARAVCVLNRRGRARLLACRTCHELARCEVCGATVEQQEAGFAARAARRRVRRCVSTATARRSAPSGPGSPACATSSRRCCRAPTCRRRRRRHRRGARRPTCSSAPRRCCTGPRAAAAVGAGRVPRARPGAARAAGPRRRAGALAARPRRPAARGRRVDETRSPAAADPAARARGGAAARQGDPMRSSPPRPPAAGARLPAVRRARRAARRRRGGRRRVRRARGRGGRSPCSGRSPTERRVDPCAAAGAVVRRALRRARAPGGRRRPRHGAPPDRRRSAPGLSVGSARRSHG